MNISSTRLPNPTKPVLVSARRTSQLAPFDPGVTNYHGPVDGLSQDVKHKFAIRSVANGIVSLFYRVEREGEENLPESGSYVYAVNHASYLDAMVAVGMPKHDVRTMATIGLFESKLTGTVATAAGVFPVNRDKVHEVSREHPKDLLNEGKGFLIFPEGTFYKEATQGKIGPFKKGVAAISIEGDAEAIVPMVMHYAKDSKDRSAEELTGWLLAGAAAVAGVVAGISGDPLCRTIGAAITGAITGASLLGQRAASKTENEYFFAPQAKASAAAKGILTGALLGGIAASIGVNSGSFGPALSVALSGTAGMALGDLASKWSHRPVATIRVGEKLDTKPYRDMAKESPEAHRQAIIQLTEDLHERMGTMKADMSGVPYDGDAPKIQDGFPPCCYEPHLSLC